MAKVSESKAPPIIKHHTSNHQPRHAARQWPRRMGIYFDQNDSDYGVKNNKKERRHVLRGRTAATRDINTVERCAPIVHINQKYPIYNYCRSRLIYIYTPRTGTLSLLSQGSQGDTAAAAEEEYAVSNGLLT